MRGNNESARDYIGNKPKRRIAEALGPSLLITLVLGGLIVILGLAITGDFAKLWTGWPGYNPGLGYTLVDVGLGAFLVYIFIDTLLLREKRLYWREVGDKARNLVKTELMGIVADVNLAASVAAGGFASPDATNEELLASERQSVLNEMKRLSNDMEALRANVSEDLLDRKCGEIFSIRAKRLGDLQLRYWSNFLEPKLVSLIIDIEQLLDVLDTHVAIASKDRERARSSTPSQLSTRLAALNVEEVYKDLQNLLKKLVEGIQQGYIEIP